jgi:hypothetical protein
MCEIKGPEAHTHLPQSELRLEEIDKAMDGIREVGKRTSDVTLKELLSARDEGRK